MPNKTLIFSGAGIAIIVGIVTAFSIFQTNNPVNDSSSSETSNSIISSAASETPVSSDELTDNQPNPDDFQTLKNQYKDGTFTASGDYNSPGGQESVNVTVGLIGGIIESINIEGVNNNQTSDRYQQLFIEGVSGEVVGQDINEVEIGIINGSSLTGAGFNKAIEAIRTEAIN